MHAIKTTILFLIALILILGTAGCRKVYKVEASKISERWVFSIPEIASGLKKGKSFLLIDFAIHKRPCEQNCAVWEFAIEEQPNTLNSDDPIAFTNKLAYGLLPGGMLASVPAKTLETGEHTIAGTIAKYDRDGKPAATLLLHGEFRVQ